jgi:hypothetical protein
MSVAEMKAKAFEKLAALQSAADIEEILIHLEKLNTNPKDKFDADVFFKKAVEKYGDVLKKLAE